MAQNAEEFNRVAAEVCTDVNGNFNQAAYDLAQTMYNNLTSVKTDLASVAKQAHQTAKAIAGVASGTVAGSADVQGGSGGGTGGSGIKLNLTSGSLRGQNIPTPLRKAIWRTLFPRLNWMFPSTKTRSARLMDKLRLCRR